METAIPDQEDDAQEQLEIPCVIMRGGTSKALFFHDGDLPPPGPGRDRLLKRAMGSPDVMQIDGLGGSRLLTSKVAIVKRSGDPRADVEYTFAQVDVSDDFIEHDANCGNISAAVGPFAIDEGLVQPGAPITTIRIYNTNTRKIIVAKVPTAGGKARVAGTCTIAGVPGSGAEILLDYAGTIGAKTGKLLPTGNSTDTVRLENGISIKVTICDAANPCVFASAQDLGLTGSELASEINGNERLIRLIVEVQAKVGQLLGLWSDWAAQQAPTLPMFVVVAPVCAYTDMNGLVQPAASMDLRARLVFLGKCIETMAGTGSICTAAASRITGTIVHTACGSATTESHTLRIGHPLGVMSVHVRAEPVAGSTSPRFLELGLTRTARRLMAGRAYIPSSSVEDWRATNSENFH